MQACLGKSLTFTNAVCHVMVDRLNLTAAGTSRRPSEINKRRDDHCNQLSGKKKAGNRAEGRSQTLSETGRNRSKDCPLVRLLLTVGVSCLKTWMKTQPWPACVNPQCCTLEMLLKTPHDKQGVMGVGRTEFISCGKPAF